MLVVERVIDVQPAVDEHPVAQPAPRVDAQRPHAAPAISYDSIPPTCEW
jgi:hypothetical protein